MSTPRIFDQEHYDRLNAARGAVVTSLLSELGASLGLRTAIDVGCGVGHFSGALQSLGLDVQAADGRLENVEEARRRFPGIRFYQRDAEDAALRDLGEFDLVFCFGLLYHLENPLATVRHLHAMTSKLLLVEGIIFPGDEPVMALVDEGPTEDQGLNHIAFYPTEACLVKMLYRAGFPNVYRSKTQPDHPDYHAGRAGRRVRTVLAASVNPITSALLVRLDETSTPIVPWDRTSGLFGYKAAKIYRNAKQLLTYDLWLPTWHFCLNLTRPARARLGLRSKASRQASQNDSSGVGLLR